MEQNTDLMWWTIGVIVIGALLIRIGSVLAKVKMLADKDNVKGVETADGYIVAKIRDEDKTKNKSTIYIFLTKNADGTLTIDHAKEVEGEGPALADSTGELYIPDKVNGLDITVIKTAPFETSNFTKLKLPKNLKTIEPKAFVTSYFKGDLVLPESIEVIGELAFYSAKFSSKLILPPKLKEISESTFFNSKFTGELSLPENIKSIGSYAFQHSTFTGELNLPENIEYIGKGAFEKSTFTGTFKSISNLKTIDSGAFYNSKFTGDFKGFESLETIGNVAFMKSTFNGRFVTPSSLKTIGRSAFKNSKFTGILNLFNRSTIESEAFYNSLFTQVNNPRNLHTTKELIMPQDSIWHTAIRLSTGEYYSNPSE